MPRELWSRHRRHWHDERGGTHRQAPRILPILPPRLVPTPQPAECWQCLAPIDPTADRCRECGAETVLF